MTRKFNYFIKKMLRQKATFLINLIGLSVSFFICICIFLYVNYETGYDKDQTNKDNTYRLVELGDLIFPAAMYKHIDGNLKGVEKICRISDRAMIANYQGTTHKLNHSFIVDTNFFSIFDLDIIEGKLEDSHRPHSAFISENTAKRIFGDASPMGQIIKLNNASNVTIRGIFKEISPQSWMSKVEFITSLDIINDMNPNELTRYSNCAYEYFFLKSPNTDPQSIIKDLVNIDFGENTDYYIDKNSKLQLLTDIHLKSYELGWDMRSRGDIRMVRQITLIGILILIVAIFNYVNLSTARSSLRAKEVGVRKMLGVSQYTLRWQFILEALFMSTLSIIIGLILFEIFGKFIGTYIGFDLSFSYVSPVYSIIFILALILVSGFSAGVYPAYVLSSFTCMQVLRSNKIYQKEIFGKKFRFQFRHLLVSFQFITSAFLIGSTLFMHQQMEYMKNKDMGVKRSGCIMIANRDDNAGQRYARIKVDLEKSPYVTNVTGSHNMINQIINNYSEFQFSDSTGGQNYYAGLISVDYDYFQKMEAKIIQGRDFNKGDVNREKCIINEAMLQKLGVNPLNQQIKGFYNDRDYEVVGIVKNIFFNNISLAVNPTVFMVRQEDYPSCSRFIYVNYEDKYPKEVYNEIKEYWNSNYTEWPLEAFYLDNLIMKSFKSDQADSRKISFLSLFAVFISALGLMGLIFFHIENKTKEFGIKLVLGASVFSLSKAISKEMVAISIISWLISIPLTSLFINKWLLNFHYHIQLSWYIYLIAGISIVVLSLLCIYIQLFFFSKKKAIELIQSE